MIGAMAGVLPACRAGLWRSPTGDRYSDQVARPQGASAIDASVAQLLHAAAANPARSDDSVGALVALGHAAIPGLTAGLHDPNDDVRLAAIQALAKIGGPDVVEPLLVAIDDNNDNLRVEALRALGTLRDRRAVQPLLQQYAKDPSPQVRYECLTSLGLIGDSAAVPVLLKGTADTDPYVRMWSMDALCQMGDARAAKLAAPLLDDPSVYVRRQVLYSCGSAFDTPEGREGLLHAALTNSDFECTMRARRYLMEYAGKDADGGELQRAMRTAAVAALKGSRPELAAFVLGDLHDPAALSELTRALHDPNAFVRHSAAYGLGKIGDRRAVPALIKALQDPVPFVAATAFNSLQWFAAAGDQRAQRAVKDYKGQKFDHPLPKT
jgi:HEAT repeat protein